MTPLPIPSSRVLKIAALFVAFSTGLGWGQNLVKDTASRVWVSQQGSTLTAKLISITDQHAELQNEQGTVFKVPFTQLSATDQRYIAAWAAHQGIALNLQTAAATPNASRSAMPASATRDSVSNASLSAPLAWPSTVSVDPSKLVIEDGEQNAEARRYEYRAGRFQFTSQAPLANSVMKQVARDFELVNELYKQLPWGWQSQPLNGEPFYFAELYETEMDYLKAGGGDNTSGWSKDNRIMTKFESLGLKKVGGKYAQDSTKENNTGSLISLITRLIAADMQALTPLWASMGIEEFLEKCAYRNGTFDFSSPQRALKEEVQRRENWGTATDVSRMVQMLDRRRFDNRQNSAELRRQDFLDSLLLVYFFAYLDDDGKGTKFHQFFRNISQEALAWRQYRINPTSSNRPHTKSGNMSEWAFDHTALLINQRSKEQLSQDIIAKYKAIGLRLNPGPK